MGRKTGYDKAAEKDKLLNRDTIIKEKLNKKDINTEEMAALVGITDRSVRDILEKLCMQYDELNIQDFKVGRAYKFKAEWNGLLAILIEMAGMPKYDKRKDPYSLEGHIDQLNGLLEGVDNYLSKPDQLLVKTHGSYEQAELELKLYDSVIHRIGLVANQVGMMPASLRFQTLAGINQALEYIPSHMAHKNASYLVEKHLYEREAQESNEINETSFQEDLEAYLVSLLQQRLRGQDGVEESFNIEVAGNTMLEQMVLGNITGIEIEGIQSVATKTREELLEQAEIKETLQKVGAVLDKEKMVDRVVLSWIEELLLILGTTVGNKDKNMKFGKELLRQMVTEEVRNQMDNLMKSNKSSPK